MSGYFPGFLLGIFSGGGGGAKSIVMHISIVIVLFSDQISGRSDSFQGGANCLRGAPPAPMWKKASFLENSYNCKSVKL